MYYILPKETLLAMAQTETHRKFVGHYLDLSDGSVLAKLKFCDEGAALRFEAHRSVTSLPHPSLNKAVGKDVAAKLSHLGVSENHTTHDVAELAAKVFTMMRFR